MERSTVKRLALFKDHHGVLGVPAGCGVGKSWVFTRRFTPVAELILAVDYGGNVGNRKSGRIIIGVIY